MTTLDHARWRAPLVRRLGWQNGSEDADTIFVSQRFYQHFVSLWRWQRRMLDDVTRGAER